MNGDASGSDKIIRDLVIDFLELLPENLRRVVRLGSIPNAITPDLIQSMTKEQIDIANILETLEQYYFINEGEGGWYRFSPGVLEVLRAFWKQPQHIEEFRRANQAAIVYFDELAKKTNPPGSYAFQREALYHRLLADENAGLEYMAELFEQACDQRQIGAAQNFSIQLTQTLPQLSPLASQYALYYEIRLDFLLNWQEKMEERLEVIINGTSDLLLKARASILLGQVWLTKYEWKRSADVIKSSLEALMKLKAWRHAARTMLSLGDIYVDLVENSGGVQPESTSYTSRLSRFLTRSLFFPSLMLDWLRRKIWFVPGWLYFGGNYQEWILNYLLQMAGSWYRKAWGMAQKAQDDTTSLDALLGQANVAVQQRREAKARRMYSRLTNLPAVQSSRYRLAQVLYGQGQVSLLANHRTKAAQELQSALNIFRSFADEVNIGLVAHALGKTYLQLDDNESASRAFLESLQAYRETKDPLSQTQVAWELQQLVEKKQVTNSVEQQIEQTLAGIQEKQYLVRFPSDQLQKFRSLVTWVALPISYLLILLIGLAASVLLLASESLVLQLSSTGKLSFADFIYFIVGGATPILLTFWILIFLTCSIIGLIYAGVGQARVLMAGRISLNLLGEQPDRIILSSEAITLTRPDSSKSIRLEWSGVQKLVSADYKLWQRPIQLLSGYAMVSGSKSILIDGITSGYMQISKEIKQKLGGIVQELNADLVLLAHRSTFIAVLFAVLHAQLLISAGQFELTVESENTGAIHLFLTPLLALFIVNVLVIFPPLILWRIYLQRRILGQQLGNQPRGYRNFLFVSIMIILSIVAILWLIVSPVLKVNGDESTQNANAHEQTLLLNRSLFTHQIKSEVSDEMVSECLRCDYNLGTRSKPLSYTLPPLTTKTGTRRCLFSF
jgi:hypothetical protein